MRNFLRFLAFWLDILFLRMPTLGVQAFKRLDLIYGGLPVLIGTGFAAYLELIPWWTVFIVLLGFGWMWAVYTKFQEVQDRNQELEEKLASAKKRKAVKDLLGDAMDQGNILRQSHRKDNEGKITLTSHQNVVDWAERTHDLIEAAFDKAEARHFMNSDDYKPEKTLPWREVRVDPYKYHLKPRLRRLHELVIRANELPISPDFDPQDWTK